MKLLRAHPRLGGLRTLETDGNEDVKEVIERLKASGRYEYVEPDYIRYVQAVPNDARFASDQWSLNNTGQGAGTAGADIGATRAWDLQREAPDVVVAVMDTGVLLEHEDIAENLWVNRGEPREKNSLDDDGNGYVDDVHGLNATVPKQSLVAGLPNDTNGHGSHVAGIIGAIGNNEKGVAGIAWKVQIMPLKFIGDGGGTVSAAVACIDYAIANRAHIINGSYGSAGYSQTEYDALKRARDAGIIVVAAAGNDNEEISDYPMYPAAYPLDNIIAVASTTRNDKLATYSTYGSGLVDLAAPGSSILSLGITADTPYVSQSGTSMAAPHVAGALALLKQKFPDDNYRGLINRLLSSVDVLSSLDNRVHTNGRLNLAKALATTEKRPFNDDFARAAVITGEFNTVRGSNQFATTETAEPNHGVAGTGATLWWRWTAPEAIGKATLSAAGSEIDTVLAVYALPRTGPATLENAQRVAFNDDTPTGKTSTVTFDVTPGTTYAVALAGKAAEQGAIAFNLLTVAVNDSFANARLLTGRSVTLQANNASAGGEPGEPRPKSSRGTTLGVNRSLWFKWIAPVTHNFQISAVDVTTDPLISLYTGSSLQNLSEVGVDDDSGAFNDSLLRFSATAGVTYYIRVDSALAPGGRFRLSIADAAWQFSAEYPIFASPAVGPDGTLYVPDALGIIHAVNREGVRKWMSLDAIGFIYGGSVAVAADGTIYVGNGFGSLYALNPADGKEKWVYETNDFIWAAPAIAANGTIYVRSTDGHLHAVNPDGTRKWRVAVPGETYSSPVVGSDGTIYCAADAENALVALDADGKEKWSAALGSAAYSSPAIGADGTIYIGNYDGRFFALRPDGTERWHFDTGSPLSGSAVIDARGYIYFGGYDKKLYALDAATGAKKWEYETGDVIRSTAPLIADDGTIYIGSDDGFMHALNPDGTLQRTYATAGPILGTPVLSAGRLYIGSSDAKVYAFDTGNNLARAPWPMHRHNLRRAARVTDLPGIPAFTAQPASTTGSAGAAITLSAGASVSGGGAVTYQWFFNDALVPGATSAAFTLSSAQGSDAGTYRVVASGSGGAIISHAATLTILASATHTARLTNLAVRTSAGPGNAALLVGFSIGGAQTTGDKPLLLRAIGPALREFGVASALDDPTLQVLSPTGAVLGENNDWAGDPQVAAISPQLGAFPLTSTTSKDAALLLTPGAGSYSARISSTTTASGLVLAEIYDASAGESVTAATRRLINVSALAHVGTGGDVLIAGFSITGTTAKSVLVRGIGPTLGAFGVAGTLGDPKLELYLSGTTTPISSNDNWGAATNARQIESAAASVGAFPLALESKDAVLLLTLQPGTYSAQVNGQNNTTGSALIEVYEVP